MSNTMSKGEWGNVLRFGVDIDISANINTLILISPAPEYNEILKSAADGVSVGVAEFTDEGAGITFAAGKYIEYPVEEGVISSDGIWGARVASKATNDSYNKITKSPTKFKVEK